jgi:predicted permease
MSWWLRCAFSVVLVTMLCVTGWASVHVPLWHTPRAVVLHPWFIATLFDAYFGFLTFYLWLAWRETRAMPRIVWLLALLALGNIAMSAYMLQLLWRLPADATMAQLLLRHGTRRA